MCDCKRPKKKAGKRRAEKDESQMKHKRELPDIITGKQSLFLNHDLQSWQKVNETPGPNTRNVKNLPSPWTTLIEHWNICEKPFSGGNSVQEVEGQSFANFRQICFDFS